MLCSCRNPLYSAAVHRHAYKLHIYTAGCIVLCISIVSAGLRATGLLATPREKYGPGCESDGTRLCLCRNTCLAGWTMASLALPPFNCMQSTVLFGLGLVVTVVQLAVRLVCSQVVNVNVDGVSSASICISVPALQGASPGVFVTISASCCYHWPQLLASAPR